MAPGRRGSTRVTPDNLNPARQQGGDSSQGTVANEPSNGRNEHQGHLIPSEIAARLDPVFLQRYYDSCARVYQRWMERELEQMEREEADDSRQFHASIGGIQYNLPR